VLWKCRVRGVRGCMVRSGVCVLFGSATTSTVSTAERVSQAVDVAVSLGSGFGCVRPARSAETKALVLSPPDGAAYKTAIPQAQPNSR